jgi:hypothetical protein
MRTSCHRRITTCFAIASSFCLLSCAATRRPSTACSLAFHSRNDCSGISSRNRRDGKSPEEFNSASSVAFTEDSVRSTLVVASKAGKAGDGFCGTKEDIFFVLGVPFRCVRLAHPVPRPSQQPLHKPHSTAAFLLQPWTAHCSLEPAITGDVDWRE